MNRRAGGTAEGTKVGVLFWGGAGRGGRRVRQELRQ
jgi:hypothetical protein